MTTSPASAALPFAQVDETFKYGPVPKEKKGCSHFTTDPLTGEQIKCKLKVKEIDVFLKCKCDLIFCRAHRAIQAHKCTFDHLEAHRKILKAQLEYAGKELKVNHNIRGHGSAY